MGRPFSRAERRLPFITALPSRISIVTLNQATISIVLPMAAGSSERKYRRTARPSGVFATLSDKADQQTVALIEETAKTKAPARSDLRKIADLYNSYMNEEAIEQRGLAPLRPHLQAIASIKDKPELARALGETLRADVDPLNNTNFNTVNLFGLWVAPGFDDPEHYHAYLLQGGLVLPDREYYLADTESMREIRAKYQTHAAAIFASPGLTKRKIVLRA